MKNDKKSRAIERSLIKQLKSKGADIAHFRGLIKDYIFYYETVESMKEDIRTKGTTYPAVSSVGKEYEKDNPNVKLMPTYTRQMLSILKDLGLTTDNVVTKVDDLL